MLPSPCIYLFPFYLFPLNALQNENKKEVSDETIMQGFARFNTEYE